MDKLASYYLENYDIVGFPKLGLEFTINKIAFTIFGLEVRWYGVIIALGMLLALIYAFNRMKEFGLDIDRAIDAILVGVIGGMVGARAYYIIFDKSTGFEDFFKIRNGGLAIYGGIIGALLIGGIVAKLRKVRLAPMLDIVSLGFLIGQGIGRWGNFVNKEAFGAETNLPWGMATATVQNVIGGGVGTAVMAHPCFLYESIWCFIGFALLHFYSKKRRFDGEIFIMYVGWYGLGRFFIEGLRMDSLMMGNLRISQLLAALCVFIALALLIIIRSKCKREENHILYRDTEESAELVRQTAEKNASLKNKAKKVANSNSLIDEADVQCTESTHIDRTLEIEKDSVNEDNDDCEAKKDE